MKKSSPLKFALKSFENLKIFIAVLLSKNSTYFLINYWKSPYREKLIRLIRAVTKETNMLLAIGESLQIYSTAKNTLKIPGEIAEVGVYAGGSARLICEVKEDKELHLFDTFEGLPALTQKDDDKQFHKGQFADTSLSFVKKYLRAYKKVYFYKGKFPSTGSAITRKKFCFVHLDVDLYQPTLDSLKFFYKKISPGGIILSHDYQSAQGVKRAVDEFFRDKPEAIVELTDSQCLIVKI